MDPSPETSRAFQGSRKNSKKGKKSLSVGSEALPGARGRSEPRAAGIRPAQESSGFSGIRGSGGAPIPPERPRDAPGMRENPEGCGGRGKQATGKSLEKGPGYIPSSREPLQALGRGGWGEAWPRESRGIHSQSSPGFPGSKGPHPGAPRSSPIPPIPGIPVPPDLPDPGEFLWIIFPKK